MMLSGLEFPPEPYHLDDQSAEPMLALTASGFIFEVPRRNVDFPNGTFVLIDRPDELLGVNFAAAPIAADAGKLEIYDYPGEYLQRFDGVDTGGNDSIWIDIGFPVRNSSSGGTFKPLFAFYVEDLDNRVNVNVHGNVMVGGDHGSGQITDERPVTYNWVWQFQRTRTSAMEHLQVSSDVAGQQSDSSVTDGASNTLMVGERPPSPSLPTLPQYWVFGTEVPAANQGWGKWEVSFSQNIVNFIDGDSYAADSVAVDPNNPNAEITIVVYSGRPAGGQDLTIIVAAGPGAGPHAMLNDRLMSNVISFEVKTVNSYQGFAGGVFVAAGDVNADGVTDIIVGADTGAPGGQVKVFSGKTGVVMSSFLAYPAGFSGDVVVAGGDVNGDRNLDTLDAIFAAEASNPTGLFSAANR